MMQDLSIRTGALFNWLVQFYVVGMNLYILVNIINYASSLRPPPHPNGQSHGSLPQAHHLHGAY